MRARVVASAAARKAYDYVVVGGGTAGGYVARALAEAGASFAVLGAEPSAPYERPALTKAFLHRDAPARLPGFHTCVGCSGERQTPAWYEAKGAGLLLDDAVERCDLAAQTLRTAAGTDVQYAKAVFVATGCTALRLPERIGGALPGVHYVRNEQDALRLYAAMETAKRAVVVGGGYIGLECAAALATWGLPTDVVLMETHLMARLWTPEISAHYEGLYVSKGVTFHKESKLARIVAGESGAAAGVELEGGATLDADLVVVGVGAGAPTAPFDALDAAAKPVGGILVDGSMRASGGGAKPGSVYAVGDIAAFPLACGGGRLVRMEHVLHARESAAHAVKAALTGSTEPYDYTPYFYSRVFEHGGSDRKVAWVFYGLQTGDVTVVGDFAPKLAAFWVDGGKLVGVMLESGSPEEVGALKAVARAQPEVDPAALSAAATVEDALRLIGVGA